MSNYAYLIELWEWAAKNCSDSEMKARIRGVDVHMKTFDFVFGVCLGELILSCLLYTSPSPRDKRQSRMPSSA